MITMTTLKPVALIIDSSLSGDTTNTEVHWEKQQPMRSSKKKGKAWILDIALLTGG